ncbi:MAG: type II secretion system F family protein [Pseudomonadota bacterium]
MDRQEIYVILGAGLIILLLLFALSCMVLVERHTRAQRVLGAASKARGRTTQRSESTIGLSDRALKFMQGVTGGLTILKERQVKEAKALLSSAGYRSKDALVVYSFFKLTGPLIALAGAAILIFGFDPIGKGVWLDGAAVFGAALLGSRMPDIVVGHVRTKRLEEIKKSFPDALDMLVICCEAGLSTDSALKRVAAESNRTETILGKELELTVQEMGFMPERRMALENLEERVPLPPIKAFSNTMTQAERYGTPMARALRVLSQELRNERMMRAEEKAGRLPATMTVPMMLFILPALFVVLIGPAALDIIDNFIGAQ